MTAERLDTAELAAMVLPIRRRLGETRHEVASLVYDRGQARTRAKRVAVDDRLALARLRRDTYKRLLIDVQACIDAEDGHVLSPFAIEFLAQQVEIVVVS